MLKIKWEMSKSGHRVPSLNGICLASKFDPIAEAVKWVANYKESIFKSKTLFVLGLGAGFHVLELQRKMGDRKIIVLEPVTELIDDFISSHPYVTNDIKVLNIKGSQDLVNDPVIQKHLRSLFTILVHAPSTRIHKTHFKNVKEILTGRDLRALYFHLQCRPEMNTFFEGLKIRQLERKGLVELNEDFLFSIKHISSAIHEGVFPLQREGMLWMALKEMVK
jgi:hypothetical protein